MNKVELKGKVLFVADYKFNGGGVNNYIIQVTIDDKSTNINCKQFYKDENPAIMFLKDENVYIRGELKNDSYKDKQTQEWINKGVIVLIDTIMSAHEYDQINSFI